MSTMRSGREIRSIVENARNFSNTSKTNNYDMILEEESDSRFVLEKK